MQAIVYWLTSQSGVSLIVALIALGGVLITTRWNNAAADKRRKEDQEAAYAMRKADYDQRDREWREQLRREDWQRQRSSIIACVKKMRAAEAEDDFSIKKKLLDNQDLYQDDEEWLKLKYERINRNERFYHHCTALVQEFEIEVTDPEVSMYVLKLANCLESEIHTFGEYRDTDFPEFLERYGEVSGLTTDMQKCINDVLASARKNLHSHHGS